MLISKWQRLPFETSNVLNSPWRFNNDLLSIYHLWMNDRRFNNDLLSICHLWMNDRWSVLFPADVTRQFFLISRNINFTHYAHIHWVLWNMTWRCTKAGVSFSMVFSNISYTWPIFSWSFWKVNKILKNDASVASSAYKSYLRTMSAKTLSPGRRSISSQQLLWVVLKVWMLSVFDKV